MQTKGEDIKFTISSSFEVKKEKDYTQLRLASQKTILKTKFWKDRKVRSVDETYPLFPYSSLDITFFDRNKVPEQLIQKEKFRVNLKLNYIENYNKKLK